MQSLPTGQGQDGRGTKHTFDAGKMGSRDDGKTTLNRKGLFVKKTNIELVEDIRRSGQVIDTCWYEAFPLGREVDLDGLQKIESHANALHLYCKLLRQRLEATQATLTEGE
jgi:hypothetical protein